MLVEHDELDVVVVLGRSSYKSRLKRLKKVLYKLRLHSERNTSAAENVDQSNRKGI